MYLDFKLDLFWTELNLWFELVFCLVYFEITLVELLEKQITYFSRLDLIFMLQLKSNIIMSLVFYLKWKLNVSYFSNENLKI